MKLGDEGDSVGVKHFYLAVWGDTLKLIGTLYAAEFICLVHHIPVPHIN
jgi:Co/Zn/Cd efflux system component